MDVLARRVDNYSACEHPGDYFIKPPDASEIRRLSFLCPCGCGMLASIRVRTDGQGSDGAWSWDNNEDCPTATPSININDGHWHGYLTAGVFKRC